LQDINKVYRFALSSNKLYVLLLKVKIMLQNIKNNKELISRLSMFSSFHKNTIEDKRKISEVMEIIRLKNIDLINVE
jgi:hypothetical protein